MLNKSKLGQMKIQQMAFMLIAVTLFFVLVGMFFLMIVFSDLGRSAEILEEKDALMLVSRLANSPEFSCGSVFGGTKLNCVDFDKVMALQKRENRYSDFWGVKGIEIRKIYPEFYGRCTIDNYPECRDILIIDRKGTGVGVSNFVALCRNENIEGRIQEKCELARIIVYN